MSGLPANYKNITQANKHDKQKLLYIEIKIKINADSGNPNARLVIFFWSRNC